MTILNISKFLLENKIFVFLMLILLSKDIKSQEDLDNDSHQEKEENIYVEDTVTYKYGFRLGVDIVAPIQMILDDKKKIYKGSFDFRVYNKYFVAGELGYQSQIHISNDLKYNVDGYFITIGGDVDYLGQSSKLARNDVMIFGIRYGLAKFTQTVDEYRIQNAYWNDDPFIGSIPEKSTVAHWLNFKTGLKVEVIKNIFISTYVGVNFLLVANKKQSFYNLFIPGYGKNRDNKSFEFGYSVMYLLPFN